ncbi:hypothetical protein E2562_030353 [Oryza meyeriana var. granulata]|uniref:Uncharacterized protein n=1 Tax=Oryza meyeriana var. granulata TaxID=110450 RepID=A0A6G1DPV9_9ORYZ|nr:hypothetical protein E2562_030353 [Oryza meyeriana var. granulata]
MHRERIRLLDVLEDGDISKFVRQPTGMESLLKTKALHNIALIGSEPNMFRCTPTFTAAPLVCIVAGQDGAALQAATIVDCDHESQQVQE